MITFQEEPWFQALAEMEKLWPVHWAEVGTDTVRLKLDPDYEKFARLNSVGALLVITARKDGELVGYHVSILDQLLHYKTIFAAKSDMYILRKDCRVGRAPVRMFEAFEQACKKRGVKVLFDRTKFSLYKGPFFEHLGYSKVDEGYMKWIGDDDGNRSGSIGRSLDAG